MKGYPEQCSPTFHTQAHRENNMCTLRQDYIYAEFGVPGECLEDYYMKLGEKKLTHNF